LKDFSVARDYTKTGTRSKTQTGEGGFEGGADKNRQNDVVAGALTKWETDTLRQVGRPWWPTVAYWQIAALGHSILLASLGAASGKSAQIGFTAESARGKGGLDEERSFIRDGEWFG
jgi:hypothetical protein